jgi:hypothetical protein
MQLELNFVASERDNDSEYQLEVRKAKSGGQTRNFDSVKTADPKSLPSGRK